jgi:hypothetical protein
LTDEEATSLRLSLEIEATERQAYDVRCSAFFAVASDAAITVVIMLLCAICGMGATCTISALCIALAGRMAWSMVTMIMAQRQLLVLLNDIMVDVRVLATKYDTHPLGK